MKKEKPPLGIMPAWLWKETRMQGLVAAIERRTRAGLFDELAIGWCEELLGMLKERKETKDEKTDLAPQRR